MKKLMIIAIMCSLSLGAFAQKWVRGRNFHRPHVVLSIGAYAPYYPYYGYYSPLYRPFDYKDFEILELGNWEIAVFLKSFADPSSRILWNMRITAISQFPNSKISKFLL